MSMGEIKIFEPAKCCTSDGCGSASDEILLNFSETLKMIEKKYEQDVSIKWGIN